MVHSALGALLIFITGAVAAVLGSLAGLGGGFLIVPVLRLFFEIPPAVAAGGALLFVFANTLAASITYVRNRVVDLPRGLTISAAGIPASIAGAYVVRFLTARNFDTVYGIFLVLVAIMVLTRRNAPPKPRELSKTAKIGVEILVGLFVGFVSSLFGIGGGIVLVPVMLVFFRQPIHTVAATSAFVIMLTSPTGVIAHGLYGDLDPWVGAPLFAGGLVGGGMGARLARRMHPHHLTLLIAGLLFVAALALVIKHLGG